ncbi:hypothetical protein O9992_24640 [Vibrio lentus]|nr:hypothetical protein [Vibrio lentus]
MQQHTSKLFVQQKVTDEFDGEVQIELYGYWTMEDAQLIDLGIKQAIVTVLVMRRLAGVSWTEEDLIKNAKIIGYWN